MSGVVGPRRIIITPPAFVNEYSMTFDGVDERVNCGNIPTTNAMSISFWIKTTSTGNLNAVIAKDSTGTTRSYLALWRGAASGLRKLYFIVFHNSSATLFTQVVSPANIIDDGNWHHILVTFTGDTSTNGLKMFLDGSLVSQATAASGTVWNTNANVTIGALSSGIDWNFVGSVDEIAIWNTDQSANISTIYNAGTPSDLSSLSPNHWWRMGDGDTWGGSSWTLTDNGSGGNDATSVNMEEADRVTNVP